MTRTLITLLALLAAVAAQAQTAAGKPVRRAAPPKVPQLVLPPAAGEQLAAAALTYFGDYACEFKQTLQVGLTPGADGYVDVRFGKQLYTMKPVLSHTGALRLEDVRGRMLLVQIAMKSMLMDVQVGHRLVDDCMHEKQAENRRMMAAAPSQPGLGIDPVKTAADAAAAVVAPAAAASSAAVAGAAASASASAAVPAEAAASAADAGGAASAAASGR